MLKDNLKNNPGRNYLIRKAKSSDAIQIWSILKPIIRNGETYAIDRKTARTPALNNWMAGKKNCYVLEYNKQIMGSYYICPNQEGGGNHICNCGFIVQPKLIGSGYGRLMLNHSLILAQQMGFNGMQFNFVVSNNINAIGLWRNAGFDIIGRLPLAFNHPSDGLIDALIMYKSFDKKS